MTDLDLDKLRKDAEHLKREWESGDLVPHPSADPVAHVGAVADGCLALIAEVDRLKEWQRRVIRHAEAAEGRVPRDVTAAIDLIEDITS